MGTFTTVGGWFPLPHGPFGFRYEVPYFDKSGNFKLPEAKVFTYNAEKKIWTSEALDQGVRRSSTASWVSSERLRRG